MLEVSARYCSRHRRPGIAAPYTAQLGGGPLATGLVLASAAASTTILIPLFIRFARPRQRATSMGPLAALTCGTLTLTAPHPDLAVSLVIFSLPAAFGAYQVAASTAFVVKVPQDRRGQAMGIANAGVVVGQGAAFLAAGAAAQVAAPAVIIATGGAAGAAAALVLTLRWLEVSPPGGRHAARRRPGHARAGSPALLRRLSAAVFAESFPAKRTCAVRIQVRMHLQKTRRP